MFTPPATFSVVISVLFRLLHDEISIVRHKAAKCCGLLINRLANEEDVDWSEQLAQRILGLGMSNTYKIRLTFVHICECLVKQIPSELFLTSFLESLLALSYDKVANIRVAVARLCRMPYPKWLGADSRVANALTQMEHHDIDRDVTWFAKSRNVKARDQTKFCNYDVWVPRETRLKSSEAGEAKLPAMGAGAACTASDVEDNAEDRKYPVKNTQGDEHEGVGKAVVASESGVSPSCPEAIRRPTIEILLQGDQDAANKRGEDNGSMGAKASPTGTSVSSNMLTASRTQLRGPPLRGRRESALSAGSVVEL